MARDVRSLFTGHRSQGRPQPGAQGGDATAHPRHRPISAPHAILTIVFGLGLYLYIGEANPAILFESRWGRTIFAAFLLILATFAIGMLFVVRTSRRMLAHLNEAGASTRTRPRDSRRR